MLRVLILLHIRQLSVCMREKDWRCRARVPRREHPDGLMSPAFRAWLWSQMAVVTVAEQIVSSPHTMMYARTATAMAVPLRTRPTLFHLYNLLRAYPASTSATGPGRIRCGQRSSSQLPKILNNMHIPISYSILQTQVTHMQLCMHTYRTHIHTYIHT